MDIPHKPGQLRGLHVALVISLIVSLFTLSGLQWQFSQLTACVEGGSEQLSQELEQTHHVSLPADLLVGRVLGGTESRVQLWLVATAVAQISVAVFGAWIIRRHSR